MSNLGAIIFMASDVQQNWMVVQFDMSQEGDGCLWELKYAHSPVQTLKHPPKNIALLTPPSKS